MKATGPRQIGASIDTVMHNLGLSVKLRRFQVLEMWSSVVGAQIARVTTAERMDGDKLIVRVSRAPWRNELIFLKKELIAKINSAMNQEIVKDIIFR
jgi:predicted nucleic acid-binding Zn ribbon protein